MDKDEVVFYTPGTVGGSVINVAGNYIVQGGGDEGANAEHMPRQADRALRVKALEHSEAKSFRTEPRQRLDHISPSSEGHPFPTLLPFNDAAVDLISSCFTGRHEDVQFIADALGSSTGSVPARCAVWGMPGLGKSQLGLKYAHSSFELRRHTHIFAISATTVEKLTQGLVGVLNLVQHPERHNSDQAAQHCFENSEEYGFHFPRQNANGSILITTRTLEIAEALTNVAGRQHPICELKALSMIQSAELLLKKAGISSSATLDLDSAKKPVERIRCLPLAVEQAGALMKQNGFSSADRLNSLYDQHGSGEIIGWKNSLTNYEETSVLAAFTAPLRRLGANNPDVLSFLRVLVCLDPENIPLDILVLGAEKTRQQLASNTESTSTGSPGPINKRFGFRRLIAKLPGKQATPRPLAALPSVEVAPDLDLSLAQPLHHGEKTSLHIHDLIQQIVAQQTTLAHKSGGYPYHSLAVTLLSQAFPTIDDLRSPQSWAQCERVVPHVMSLVNHVGALPINLLGVLSVRVAWYFYQRGRYANAAALCQHALEGQTQRLSADHPDMMTTVNCLADAYARQGKYNEAEPLYQQALAGREQQLGGTHPDTLATVNDLAELYRQHGNPVEAETLYRRALAGYEKNLGADHPVTLLTVNNLAGLYLQQGHYDEAEPLYRRALAGKEQQLGSDHPSTLTAVRGFALLYERQGKYEEAETLYKRAWAGRETSLGIHHPSTIRTRKSLARVYVKQGRGREAKTLRACVEEAQKGRLSK
ncbi:TPR-like protein [Athelia psychrophila]|uniref:TPR-like protein n=1 Tax=Athelia psychrophila TaxID=1759441 RepID=A0A166MWK3_9AGAM|nr:TPR-like protein [Fibularhizoctonia sp. CBS 109695]